MGRWGEDESDDDEAAEAFLAAFRARRESILTGSDARGTVLGNSDLLWLIVTVYSQSVLTDEDMSISSTGLRSFMSAARVCQAWCHAVHEVLARDESGITRTFLTFCGSVGGNVVGSLEFVHPGFTTILPTGEIAVADNHRVRVLSADGQRVLSVMGVAAEALDGQSGHRGLFHPMGVASDGRLLWVADRSNNRVQALRLLDGALVGVSSRGGQVQGGVWGPYGLAHADDWLYAADANHDRVAVFHAPTLRLQRSFGGSGNMDGMCKRLMDESSAQMLALPKPHSFHIINGNA